MKQKLIAVAVGLGAAIGLLGFYYVTLRLLTGDAGYPWRQLRELQPWISLVMIGFGAQVGLWVYLKRKAMVAGSGAMSGVSMVACCAHHVIDIVPALAITGIATWLTAWQKPLLIVAILANAVGIYKLVKRHE